MMPTYVTAGAASTLLRVTLQQGNDDDDEGPQARARICAAGEVVFSSGENDLDLVAATCACIELDNGNFSLVHVPENTRSAVLPSTSGTGTLVLHSDTIASSSFGVSTVMEEDEVIRHRDKRERLSSDGTDNSQYIDQGVGVGVVCSFSAPNLKAVAVLDGPSILFQNTIDASLMMACCGNENGEETNTHSTKGSDSNVQWGRYAPVYGSGSGAWGISHNNINVLGSYWNRMGQRMCLVLMRMDKGENEKTKSGEQHSHCTDRNFDDDAFIKMEAAGGSVLLEIIIGRVTCTHNFDSSESSSYINCDTLSAIRSASCFIPDTISMRAICGCLIAEEATPEEGVIIATDNVSDNSDTMSDIREWYIGKYVNGAKVGTAIAVQKQPRSVKVFETSSACFNSTITLMVIVYDDCSGELYTFRTKAATQGHERFEDAPTKLCCIQSVSDAFVCESKLIWVQIQMEALASHDCCIICDTKNNSIKENNDNNSLIPKLRHIRNETFGTLETTVCSEDISSVECDDRGGDVEIGDVNECQATKSLQSTYESLHALYKHKCSLLTEELSVLRDKSNLINSAKNVLRDHCNILADNLAFNVVISKCCINSSGELAVYVRFAICKAALQRMTTNNSNNSKCIRFRGVCSCMIQETGFSMGSSNSIEFDYQLDTLLEPETVSKEVCICCDSKAFVEYGRGGQQSGFEFILLLSGEKMEQGGDEIASRWKSFVYPAGKFSIDEKQLEIGTESANVTVTDTRKESDIVSHFQEELLLSLDTRSRISEGAETVVEFIRSLEKTPMFGDEIGMQCAAGLNMAKITVSADTMLQLKIAIAKLRRAIQQHDDTRQVQKAGHSRSSLKECKFSRTRLQHLVSASEAMRRFASTAVSMVEAILSKEGNNDPKSDAQCNQLYEEFLQADIDSDFAMHALMRDT